MVFFFSLSSLYAQVKENDYKLYLIKKALDLNLHEDRYWQILLHYKKSKKGSVSYIDDPDFFLSPIGKNSPKDELIATIEKFFTKEEDENDHPICRFIARYEWLKEKLNINEEKLPSVNCSELNEVLSKINANSASLIFASSYPNNPASMFGHTLIRLDTENQNPLLSYGVNYSAIQEDKFPAIYTFKGIFGFYKGIYTVMPYYEKVKEYNDIERRDLWEYKLNLTPSEVKKMLLHLWELKDIYQYYYFFDENCSYNILFLLESARPSVRLTDKFSYWVIPVNTIKAVIEENMVSYVKYRPSLYTKIKFLSSSLSSDQKYESLKISTKKITPQEILNKDYSTEVKQKILEVSSEITRYLYLKKKLDEKNYKETFLNTLRARSSLEKSNSDLEIPEPNPPERGHNSSRIEIAYGYLKKSYLELSYRPAYHDITNSDEGYIENSQVVFLDTSFKYVLNNNSLKFNKIDFIDIISITPTDFFDKNFSWRAKTGMYRKPNFNNDILFYNITVSGGTAWKNNLNTLYLLGNLKGDYSGEYKSDISTGIGINIGLIIKALKDNKLIIDFENNNYFLGESNNNFRISIIYGFFISKDSQVGMKFTREQYLNYSYSDFKIYFSFFF